MSKADESPMTNIPQNEHGGDLGTQGPQGTSLSHSASSSIGKLTLPKGALIAMRVSGGSQSRTREVVIYPDGRLSYSATAARTGTRGSRQVNDAQIAQIRRTLEKINFFRMTSVPGEPGGDALAYEIAARVGTRTHDVKCLTGNIPAALNPLIQQLDTFMPKDEG
jgi:hypothetical protein